MQAYGRHRGKATFSIVSRESKGTSCSMHARLNVCLARMRGFAVRLPVLELAETWNKMSEIIGTTNTQ